MANQIFTILVIVNDCFRTPRGKFSIRKGCATSSGLYRSGSGFGNALLALRSLCVDNPRSPPVIGCIRQKAGLGLTLQLLRVDHSRSPTLIVRNSRRAGPATSHNLVNLPISSKHLRLGSNRSWTVYHHHWTWHYPQGDNSWLILTKLIKNTN